MIKISLPKYAEIRQCTPKTVYKHRNSFRTETEDLLAPYMIKEKSYGRKACEYIIDPKGIELLDKSFEFTQPFPYDITTGYPEIKTYTQPNPVESETSSYVLDADVDSMDTDQAIHQLSMVREAKDVMNSATMAKLVDLVVRGREEDKTRIEALEKDNAELKKSLEESKDKYITDVSLQLALVMERDQLKQELVEVRTQAAQSQVLDARNGELTMENLKLKNELSEVQQKLTNSLQADRTSELEENLSQMTAEKQSKEEALNEVNSKLSEQENRAEELQRRLDAMENRGFFARLFNKRV